MFKFVRGVRSRLIRRLFRAALAKTFHAVNTIRRAVNSVDLSVKGRAQQNTCNSILSVRECYVLQCAATDDTKEARSGDTAF